MPITTYVGDTGTPFKFQLTLIDGTHPNISGFTKSNFILDLYNGTTTVNCTGGTWTVIDGTNAIVQYQPTSSDLATPGVWSVYLQLVLSNGPKTFTPDTITILVKY